MVVFKRGLPESNDAGDDMTRFFVFFSFYPTLLDFILIE